MFFEAVCSFHAVISRFAPAGMRLSVLSCVRSGMDVLKVNGIEKQFGAGELPDTLSELLEYLDVNAATVVAEVEGEIVAREDFMKTQLHSGQTIELMRLMGGG